MSEVVAGAWQSAVRLAFGLGVLAFIGGMMAPAPSARPASTVQPPAPFDRLARMQVESQLFERASDKARLAVDLQGRALTDGGLELERTSLRRFQTGAEDRLSLTARGPRARALLRASRARTAGTGHSVELLRGTPLGFELAGTDGPRRLYEPGCLLPGQVLLALRLGAFGESATTLRVITGLDAPSRAATLTPTGESLRPGPKGASVKAREWTLSAGGETLWIAAIELGGERRCLRLEDPTGVWTLVRSGWAARR